MQSGTFGEVHFELLHLLHLPGGSDGKKSACNAGDPGLILGREDLLQKEIATHSSILVWEIPWTEETGGLQFMGVTRSWT